MIYTDPVFSGVIPKARITAGTSACVVAAWLYKSVLAKKKATANKNGRYHARGHGFNFRDMTFYEGIA